MSASTVTIRKCEDADLARVTEIYARSVREETASFELKAPDLEEMRRRHGVIAHDGYPYLVADIGGKVAGYAYASVYRPRPGYRHTVESTVYVDPEAQRVGIGRALMEQLIEEAESHGFRQMIAVISTSVHEASIEFHKALGFEIVGNVVSVGYKHGKWLDTIFMQRALGPGDTTPPERA